MKNSLNKYLVVNDYIVRTPISEISLHKEYKRLKTIFTNAVPLTTKQFDIINSRLEKLSYYLANNGFNELAQDLQIAYLKYRQRGIK